MAIAPGIPGLSVSIGLVSEDKPLEEFEHPRHPSHRAPERSTFHLPENHGEDEPLPFADKYIQAHPGKEFELRIGFDSSFQLSLGPTIGFMFWIDGERMGGRELKPINRTTGQKWEDRISSTVTGNETAGYKTQRFSFAPRRIGSYAIIVFIIPTLSRRLTSRGLIH